MAFFPLVITANMTILSDSVVIPADQIRYCENVIDLSEHISSLYSSLEESVQQSEQAGFAKGYDEGKKSALLAFEMKSNDSILSLNRQYQKKIAESRQQVMDVAISIINKVAKDIGSAEFIASLVMSSLAEVEFAEAMTVRVNSLNEAAVKRALLSAQQSPAASVRQNKPAFSSVQVKPDDELDIFDCVIETPFGHVLAGLDDQLKRIKDHVLAG